MRADGPTVQSTPPGLPIVGKRVPRAGHLRKTPRNARVLGTGGAGVLTQAPKNRQLAGRSASRGGTRCATTAARARSPGSERAASGSGRTPIGLSPSPGSSAAAARFRRERSARRPGVAPGAVDTQRPSDTLANRKTFVISIGSASFFPPESCCEARSSTVLADEFRRRPAKWKGSSFVFRETASARRRFGAEVARPVHSFRSRIAAKRPRPHPLVDAREASPAVRIVLTDPGSCCWTPTKRAFSRCGMRLAGTSGMEASWLAAGLANEEMGR